MQVIKRFILLLLLLALLPAYANTKASMPVALTPVRPRSGWQDSWWPQRHAEKKTLAKEGKAELVMIGDSITHWWEKNNLEQWHKFYDKFSALNLGFAADCTENVLWRIRDGALDGLSPKVVVIMIGTNNTGYRGGKGKETAKETASGIKEIVHQVRTRLPDSRVLLLAIFPRGPAADDPLRKLNTAINERIASFADGKMVYFLDIGSSFLDEDGTLPKELSKDKLHLTAKGYQIWHDAMAPKLAELMK